MVLLDDVWRIRKCGRKFAGGNENISAAMKESVFYDYAFAWQRMEVKADACAFNYDYNQ